jgi:hypothetical protein
LVWPLLVSAPQIFARIFIVPVCPIHALAVESPDELRKRVVILLWSVFYQSLKRDFFNLSPFRLGFFRQRLVNVFGNF